MLGGNHCIPLLHIAKRFIWIEETGEHINGFEVGYMINPSLHVNKSFREEGDKCIDNIFVALTQTFIKTALSKNNTGVSDL